MITKHKAFDDLDQLIKSGRLNLRDVEAVRAFIETVAAPGVSKEELREALTEILEQIDWDANANEIGVFASYLLPVHEIVPRLYASWQPIVRASFGYIASHLSPSRIIPKLADQIVNAHLPLEERIVSFISEMPTLQKLGQSIARNINIDARFRNELTRLENAINDVDPPVIFSRIRQQLGTDFEKYSVRLDDVLHSEASVGAVVRFTYCHKPSRSYKEGVFKVLKPNVSGYFWEEISILDGLAQRLEETFGSIGALAATDLHDTIEDIRQHLIPELDFRNEQKHLERARSVFASNRSVRIPRLIPELCRENLTAMSFEPGRKITDAYVGQPSKRRLLAEQLVDLFIAHPLLDAEESVLLHADPHAGNLFVNEATDELVIFDWALVEDIPSSERRQMLLFVLALSLRDPLLAVDALLKLCRDYGSPSSEKAKAISEEVRQTLIGLPFYRFPELADATELFDRLALRGITFSKTLVVFRKVLLTLDGILRELHNSIDLAPLLAKRLGEETIKGLLEFKSRHTPLSYTDAIPLALSFLWSGPRLQFDAANKLLAEWSELVRPNP